MSRKTIRNQLRTIRRKFPQRTRYGFLYLLKGDVKRKFTGIIMYCLIYSPQNGHSLFVFDSHRRGHNWTAKEWNDWINAEGLDIINDAVLPAINAKGGNDWQMRRLIGFSGKKNAIYKRQNRNKSSRRNKTHAKR